MWNKKLKEFDLSKWNPTKSQRAAIDNLFAEVEERRREFESGSYLFNYLESKVHLTDYANSLVDKVGNKVPESSCKLSYSTKIDEEGRLWNIEYRY